MRRILPLLAVAGALLAGCDGATLTTTTRPPSDEGRVVRVVDGDTIHVMVGGRREKVRYIGVDTPESHRPNTPLQCFANAATAANARLVDGERVRLVRDVEARDRYDRLLAYVYRGDVLVNERLVRDGYARVLTVPPNVRHAKRFLRAERGARRAGRGLWHACSR